MTLGPNTTALLATLDDDSAVRDLVDAAPDCLLARPLAHHAPPVAFARWVAWNVGLRPKPETRKARVTVL